MSSTRTGFCECGCGQRTRLASQHDRARGDIKGQPVRFVRGHGGSLNRGRILKEHVAAYRLTTRKGRREFLHRLRAEAALGKPLPLGAQVHHLDGTKGDNSPLVICQDDAYHKFLHFRMRIKAAGGNPDADLVCSVCRNVKPRDEFFRNRAQPSGHSHYCKVCTKARQSQRGAA